MDLLRRAFLKWLPLGLAVTMLSLVGYTVVQQVYRMDANDPQIQLAEDAAVAVAKGVPASGVVGPAKVDPSTSLAPFLIVLNSAGVVEASGARIGTGTPTPPSGVLNAARTSGENRVTWQPRADTRIASVVVPVANGTKGYVLAGRSLRVVEQRIDSLGLMAGLGWLGTLAATLVATWFVAWLRHRGRSDTGASRS
jgi:hypothetical protein